MIEPWPKFVYQKLTSSSLQENIEATVSAAMADTINTMEQKLLIQVSIIQILIYNLIYS